MSRAPLAVAAALLASLAAVCSASAECSVAARTAAGLACGLRRTHRGRPYASFRGVPYATQPLGSLRFQELLPAEPWEGYFDAREEGPICPQHDVLYGKVMYGKEVLANGMAEDCIRANIHVPWDALPRLEDPSQVKEKAQERSETNIFAPWELAEFEERSELRPARHLLPKSHVAEPPAAALRPVMVFIHGGGFAFGSGDSDLHGPEHLVSRGVVVVTFNYRLGPFGFLSLNSSSVPGNAGLRDMVTLLRWVQDNARGFGGDPGDVTLAGQSAGAAAAHLLTLSGAARGLFKRTILMSGTAARGFFTPSPLYADIMAKAFLYQLGINASDPEEAHRQLVRTPLDHIMRVHRLMLNKGGLTAFFPVVERHYPGVTTIIDKDPDVLISEGQGKDIPLMIGFTEAECEVFRPRFEEIDMLSRIKMNPVLTLSPYMIFTTPEENILEKVVSTAQRYFKNGTTMDAFLRYCTDSYFIYPALYTAQKRIDVGGASVFMYQFSFEGDYRVLESHRNKFKGAAHVEDLTYLFKTNSGAAFPDEQVASSRDGKMQDWITKLFVNFARTGNPAGPYSSEPWPAVSKDSFKYQDLRIPGVFAATPPTADHNETVRFYGELYTAKR